LEKKTEGIKQKNPTQTQTHTKLSNHFLFESKKKTQHTHTPIQNKTNKKLFHYFFVFASVAKQKLKIINSQQWISRLSQR